MKLRFIRSDFSLKTNQLPVCLGMLWLLLILISYLVRNVNSSLVSLCWFRNIFNIKCPTCGSTRIVVNLMRMRILQAFLINPLVFAFSLVIIFYLALRTFIGKDVDFIMSKRERTFTLVFFILIFFLNWLYVIMSLS